MSATKTKTYTSILKKTYPQGKYELASPIVAQLIPAIYERDPNDYMTGETWWDYGPHYIKRSNLDSWKEAYLDEYSELENYVPNTSYVDELEEDSD